MRLDFCTSLALNGTPKLAALLSSLEKHVCNTYYIWVLCEGDDTLDAVKKLPFVNIRAVLLDDFDKLYVDLLSVKPQRDAFEYNCTLRPVWMLHVLNLESNIEFLTYVDNDLFFFNNPAPIYDEFNDSSVLLTLHRISKLAELTGVDVNVVGKYNAGWLAVKNDDEARRVLTWWRERCIEWCYRIPTAGKFGEQKYLDEFQTVSKRVGTVQHLGVNVAPWNMNDLNVCSRPSGEVMVENASLIFFHFHALKIPGESAFKVDKELGEKIYQLTNPNYIITKEIMESIYKPYLKVLNEYLFVGSHNGVKISKSFWILNIPHYFKKSKRLLITFKSRIIYYLIFISTAFRELYSRR